MPARKMGAMVMKRSVSSGNAPLQMGVSISEGFVEKSRHLVTHEQGDLLQKKAEILRGGFLATHARQLVGDQRMGQNVHFAHNGTLLVCFR